MTYTILKNNSMSQIYPNLPYSLGDKLDDLLAFDIEGAQYTLLYQERKWDGKYHMYKVKTQRFPTGFMQDVVDFLNSNNVPFEIKDVHKQLELNKEPLKLHAITPWPHQEEALKQIYKNGRGLIQISTGGGKTLVIAMTHALYNLPSIVLTHKLELLYQLKHAIEKYLNIPVGIFGDGKFENQKIVVAMTQSLLKLTTDASKSDAKEFDEKDEKTEKLIQTQKDTLYKELILNRNVVMIDECHRIGASGTYKVVQKMDNACYRIGYSATAYGYRPDKKDFFIKAAVGPLIYNIRADYLISKKLLVPIDILKVNFYHNKMKYPRDYRTLYTNEVVMNETRNALICKIAIELHNKNNPVLIAVSRIDHGNLLEAALQEVLGKDNVVFLNGSNTSSKREEVLEKFKHKKLPVLISTLITEGVDIPFLSTIINARAEESKIMSLQLIGRLMRIYAGKEKAFYIDIMDRGVKYLQKHSLERSKLYGVEPGYNTIELDSNNIINYIKEGVKVCQ